MNPATFPDVEDIDWTEYGRITLSNLPKEYHETFYEWVKKDNYNLHLYENYSSIAIMCFKTEYGLK